MMFPAVRIKPQKYEQNGGELEEYSSLQADLSEESHGSDDIASSGSPGRIEIDRGSDHGSLDTDVSSTSTSSNPIAALSFGALAAAQESLRQQRKRPLSSTSEVQANEITTRPSTSTSAFPEAEERRAGKKIDPSNLSHRPSKHAPAELSSKKAVSRKREVVPTTRREVRDPRFESLSGSVNEEVLKKNYSFLNSYEADEMKILKSQIRQTKDPITAEALNRRLLSMESRQKAQATKDLQQSVIREHRKNEKAMVKQGKKPFFLKRGEQKKLALTKKFEGMGEKKRERVLERRTKKRAAKEKRTMPLDRRGAEGGIYDVAG